MRYLLTPVTMLLWTIITSICFTIAFSGIIFLFFLNWMWIIIGASFLIGIIFTLTSSLPLLLNNYILKFYGYSWFSVIAHSIAAIVACIHFFRNYLLEPIIMINEEEGSELIFVQLWDLDPVKTIFFALPFLGVILSTLYAMVIAPYQIKLSDNHE